LEKVSTPIKKKKKREKKVSKFGPCSPEVAEGEKKVIQPNSFKPEVTARKGRTDQKESEKDKSEGSHDGGGGGTTRRGVATRITMYGPRPHSLRDRKEGKGGGLGPKTSTR